MQIFISYSSRDRGIAEEIANDLIAEGFTVWLDVGGIPGGANWTTEIQNAIQSSKIVIVILSKISSESRWVQAEVLSAFMADKTILPVLTESDVKIPFYLSGIQYVNTVNRPSSEVLAQILSILRNLESREILVQQKIPKEQIEQEYDRISKQPLPDRVFIAYARLQRPIAKELAELLHKYGYVVFYDAHIYAGARWRKIIQKALDDATHLIIIWTPNARDSDEVEREVSYALAERKYIIPLLSKEIPKLPYHLHGLHYIVLEENLSAIETDLMAAIEHHSEDDGIWR